MSRVPLRLTGDRRCPRGLGAAPDQGDVRGNDGHPGPRRFSRTPHRARVVVRAPASAPGQGDQREISASRLRRRSPHRRSGLWLGQPGPTTTSGNHQVSPLARPAQHSAAPRSSPARSSPRTAAKWSAPEKAAAVPPAPAGVVGDGPGRPFWPGPGLSEPGATARPVPNRLAAARAFDPTGRPRNTGSMALGSLKRLSATIAAAATGGGANASTAGGGVSVATAIANAPSADGDGAVGACAVEVSAVGSCAVGASAPVGASAVLRGRGQRCRVLRSGSARSGSARSTPRRSRQARRPAPTPSGQARSSRSPPSRRARRLAPASTWRRPRPAQPAAQLRRKRRQRPARPRRPRSGAPAPPRWTRPAQPHPRPFAPPAPPHPPPSAPPAWPGARRRQRALRSEALRRAGSLGPSRHRRPCGPRPGPGGQPEQGLQPATRAAVRAARPACPLRPRARPVDEQTTTPGGQRRPVGWARTERVPMPAAQRPARS